MLPYDEILSAEKKIRPHVHKTPLVRCYPFEEALKFNGRLFLKCENVHPTGSFKVRGALNALLHLSQEERKKGVVTRSSGNFAQALAYAGSLLHIPTTIVMPSNAPENKKEATKRFGAHIVFTGPDRLEQEEKVFEISKEKKLAALSPFDHFHVIAGAGTIALEILEQLPTVAQFFCQIGGGGLMSGAAAGLKTAKPDIETTGIEPEGANDFFLSRKQKTRVRIPKPETIADGLLAPQVGDLTWPILQKYVDNAVTISDADIKTGMRFLYEKMGMVIEPSGAVSFACLLQHPEWLRPGADIICVLSGGNVDRDSFYKWIA